jgi:hypothetical protein
MSSAPGARGIAVSACVIARDEEQRLPDCLRSLQFCDEIVVVDSGSRDRTIEIAREHGARVVEQPWLGFGAQRNVAIDHAQGDWILEVDADERVTGTLRDEIRDFVAAPPDHIDIACMPLRETFLGAALGRSARYPRYRSRLFRRGVYRHDEDRSVHEGLWPRGQAWAFGGDLEHVLASGLGEALRDTWTYSRLEAEQSVAPGGAPGYLMRILVRPFVKLLYRLFVYGGWRDGARGFAKIALDCAADAAVGLRQIARPPRDKEAAPAPGATGPPGDPKATPGGHYARSLRVGSVHLVALALGREATAEAADWLERARGAGADVGLVSDARPDANVPLRVRSLARGGPLTVIRALDAEDQLRPIDGLVPVGARARRLTRLLPGRTMGTAETLDAGSDPVAAVRDLRDRTRGPGAG